jgi:DNA-binding PadR family transcriptional regulator
MDVATGSPWRYLCRYAIYVDMPDGPESRNRPARRKPELSPAAVRVLRALLDGSRYGFDVIDVTGLPSGTVYPILSRLHEDGLLTSTWEDAAVARREKRPPRRYYEVTADGEAVLAAALARYRELFADDRAAGLAPAAPEGNRR